MDLILANFQLRVGVCKFSLKYNHHPSIESYFQNYKLEANYDGSLKYAAFLYANPPMKNVMKFYFFNITNPDEVKYLGAKPEFIQVGAYGFL